MKGLVIAAVNYITLIFCMIPFSEWIKLYSRSVEFNFRKIDCPHQEKYLITTLDSKRNNFSFDLVLGHDGKWNILQPAPIAILQLKTQLIGIIKRHSKNQSLVQACE